MKRFFVIFLATVMLFCFTAVSYVHSDDVAKTTFIGKNRPKLLGKNRPKLLGKNKPRLLGKNRPKLFGRRSRPSPISVNINKQRPTRPLIGNRNRQNPVNPVQPVVPVASGVANNSFDMNLCSTSLSSLDKLSTVCSDMDILYGYRIPLGCTSYLPANSVNAVQKIVNNLNELLKGKGMTVSAEWMNQDLFALSSSQAQPSNQPVGVEASDDNTNLTQKGESPVSNLGTDTSDNTKKNRPGVFRRKKNLNYRIVAVAQEDATSDVNAPVDIVTDVVQDNVSTDASVNASNSLINVNTQDNTSVSETGGETGIGIIAQETTPVQEYVANITDENFCSEQKVQFDKLPKSCVELQFAFNCKSPELDATQTNDFFNLVMGFTRLFNYKYTVTTLLYKGSVAAPVDNTSTEEPVKEVQPTDDTSIEEPVKEIQPADIQPEQSDNNLQQNVDVEQPTDTNVSEPAQDQLVK